MFRSAMNYYLLLLQLFFVQSTAAQDKSYRIHALNTEPYVVSNGFEQPGHFVSTSWFEGYSPDTTVTIPRIFSCSTNW